MAKIKISMVILVNAAMWHCYSGATENTELSKFLKKQGFPAVPSEVFFSQNGLTQNQRTWGTKENSCKKSGAFYYAHSFSSEIEIPWSGIIGKTIIENGEPRKTSPGDSNWTKAEYDKIRKKFGVPFKDESTITYRTDYGNTVVDVEFYVSAFSNCVNVSTFYYKPSAPKEQRKSALSDALN